MNDKEEQISTPRPALAGLDLRELMAEGLAPSTEGDQTPPSISGFEVIRLLGSGGMGQVFLARQLSLNRLVAIKVLPVSQDIATQFLDRLEREAMAMAQISHPNIVSVFDFIRLPEGGAAIIMEFVDGGNLREEFLSSGEAISDLEKVVDITRQMVSSLAAAHRVGIVHRDVKPENVLVTTDGIIKVSDFGLALPLENEEQRLTVTGTSLGTLGYMAPEQMDASQVDARADIFSAGVILYEMLTGARPHGNFDPPRSLRSIIPSWLNDLTLLALRTNPVDRISSAEAFVEALDRKGRKSGRFQKWGIIAAAAAVLSIGGWFVVEQMSEAAVKEVPERMVSIFESSTIRGTWHVENGIYESGDEICLLALKGEPLGDSYDVNLTFTRAFGRYSIGVFFPHSNGRGSVELSAWGNNVGGVQAINGVDLRALPGSFLMPLVNGQVYELKFQVRPESIIVILDGDILQKCELSPDDKLSITGPWEWNGEGVGSGDIVLGTFQSQTTFHSVEVVRHSAE